MSYIHHKFPLVYSRMHHSVEQLILYPVKSLAGITVPSFDLCRTGIHHDRMFMLVDETGRFLTRRERPDLVQFGTAMEGSSLAIFRREDPSQILMVPLEPDVGERIMVSIWSDRCSAQAVSAEADQYFSDFLKGKVRLVYMPLSTNRRIDGRYTEGKEVTSFTDGYQILLIGSASLLDLNERLIQSGSEKIGWERFRPNVVVTTEEPFEEDKWRSFQIGELAFKGVKLCSRCVMTTMDEQTGKASKEPLRTLSAYRAKNNHIYFGQNVIAESSTGRINKGDKVIFGRS